MALLIFYIFLIVLLLIVSKLFFKPEFPFYKNPYFLTNAEKSFFHVLSSIVSDRYIICCQVGLGSLVKINKKGRKWWVHRGRLGQKSLDFVLLDKNSLEPIMAIELDDSSHLLPDRQRRDEFVEKVMKVAGIPLIRIKNQSSYNISELKSQLKILG